MATRKAKAGKRAPARKIKTAGKKLTKNVVRAVKKTGTAVKKAVRKKAAPARSRATTRKKDGRPPNWPALSPYMTVRDAAASAAFYEAAFGFRIEGELMRDASGQIMHAGMRLGEACIMFAPQGMGSEMRPPASSGGIGLSLYVYVPDVDALAARAQRAGADMRQAPKNEFWGDRIAIFVDPDGYHWTFATNVGAFNASKAPF
jgi:uncharacterized glyoxalase superfamily protein PhnB